MKAFYTLVIFLIPFVVFGQGWLKDYSNFNGTIDVGLKVSKLDNNGYILSGFSDANTGKLNILIIKTDNNGNEEWSKIIDAGEGVDDASFNNYYSDGLIYIVGIINEGLNSLERQFIRVYTLSGVLVDERLYLSQSSTGIGKIIQLNCGLVGSEWENNYNGPKFFAFDNKIGIGVYINRNVKKINKSNLDSIDSYTTPLNPSSSSYSPKIIDIEYTSYINSIESKGDYYNSDIYYLQNTNNDDQSDIYITSSSSQWCDLTNNNFYQKYGGFEDDFAYDFVLTNDSSNVTSAIVVGSTESYGNSSIYKSSSYIFKTQLSGLDLTSNQSNNIDWELVIGDGETWEIGRNITKLDNGNFLVLIENQASWAVYDNDFRYKLIEIDVNGNILCENNLDLSELLYFSYPYNINATIQLNDLITDDDGYAILLGHYAPFGLESPYQNFYSLPGANVGWDFNVFLVKIKCGETISEIKNIDINYTKKSKGIFNLLGQESNNKYNSILFEIFDDGSVDKKVIIE